MVAKMVLAAVVLVGQACPLGLRELRMFAGKHPFFNRGDELFQMAWASKEARNTYQRAYRRARGVKPKVLRVPPPCAVCGGPVPQGNRRYCSNACQLADTEKRLIAAWLTGEYNPPHGGEGRVPEYIERWWFATYGEQWIQCGWAVRRRIDGRIPLSWDHIDGDCSNNRRANLRPLCSNCHALTDTYGSLNKVSRRKRWGVRNCRTEALTGQELGSRPLRGEWLEALKDHRGL
jgi:endogenous inhibitor of DNA gyrase (YacG/DUF329 family)